ncbi:thiol-disulfide oxidoreductase DCC family protein [Streptomyces sp. NPDC054786]
MQRQSVLVYDGDCAFCTSSVRFAERRLRPRCAATPWQFTDLVRLGITQQRAEHEVLWVTPAGSVHGGAQAVAKLLMSARGGWPVVGALLMLPPVRWAAQGAYRIIANNRQRLPGGTAACALPSSRNGRNRS